MEITPVNLSKGFLLVVVALFAYLSVLLALPFFQYVLGAVLVAYILSPVQTGLERQGGISPPIAAFVLVTATVAGVVVPLVVVVALVADNARRLVENADTGSLGATDFERRIEGLTGVNVDLTATVADSAQGIGGTVLEQSTAWFSALTHTAVGLGVAIFLLYYLLKDGDALLAWIRELTPLPDDVQDDFYRELDAVMWAVLVGHVLIAVIQGTLAGLGLIATGVPNAVFWTVVMIVLSLIPLVGSFLVWGPAVGFLLLTNEPVLAVGLFVYSTIIVGLSDDYLRPILVDRYADLNPAVIILGVLGGVYAFGVMGLFYGPVVLGALIATLNVVNDNYDELEEGQGVQ